MPTYLVVLLGLLAAALLLHSIGMWAVFRRTRSRVPTLLEDLPGLSLLKPLKGKEDALADNLRSFFQQRYPGPMEIVFCATDANDAGLRVAKKVAQEFPQVDAKFVVSRDDFGLNPKVSNMQGGLGNTRYPYVLQSDANVRIEPGYLHALVSYAVAERADMVGSLVVGDGEQTLGATLENMQLTAFVAPAVCVAREVANVPCVIGKSMLVRRAALARVGDLSLVRSVLCEDFVLAQAFRNAGFVVALSPLTVSNINRMTRVRQFLARHARWLKMRAVIHVPAHAVDPLASPGIFSLAAALASRFDPYFVALHAMVLLYKSAWDWVLLRRLRGHAPSLLRLVPIGQLRDLLIFCTWIYASFSRTTRWRGQLLRMGAGSKLYPVSQEHAVELPEFSSLVPEESPKLPQRIQ